jgi:hypothetical protein
MNWTDAVRIGVVVPLNLVWGRTALLFLDDVQFLKLDTATRLLQDACSSPAATIWPGRRSVFDEVDSRM